MPTERVTFPGAQGIELSGRLELPVGSPRGLALFAHCFTCGKDLTAAVVLARALAERGIAVLRFDFTGLGESEGELAGFAGDVEDLVAAAAFLRRRGQAPALLVGHSLGGTAVLRAARAIPECRAVATIGAPADPEHARELIRPVAGGAEAEIAGRRFRVGPGLLASGGEGGVEGLLAGLDRALLVLHAPLDDVVGIDHARRIFQAARHPKSFVSLDGADHLLTRRDDARWAAGVLAAWADRYLDAAAPPEFVTPPDPQEVVVRGGPAGYVQEILAGGHPLVADEPRAVGGSDRGPTPYGLLLAALGACKSMTLRMYADRKGWPLAGVTARLRHHRLHARDCEDCEGREGLVDVVDATLSLEGDLSPEQRRRLLEIADRCPVHRTLVQEVRIRTRPGPGEPGAAEPDAGGGEM